MTIDGNLEEEEKKNGDKECEPYRWICGGLNPNQ